MWTLLKSKNSIPWASWVLVRRISQLCFLSLFFVLFRLTDYSGSDEIPWAVNIFFRWDPLVALSVTLGEGRFIPLLLPSLVIVGLTLLLGRVFCGWICPMGTILDLARKFLGRNAREARWNAPNIKFILMVIILVSAAFGLPIIGFFDPFSILVRATTCAIDPGLNLFLTGFFDSLYLHAPSWVKAFSEPAYTFLKNWVLPYRQTFFSLSLLSALFLAVIVLLERMGSRTWCSNLCPLGALLALLARFSLFRRFPSKACASCKVCLPNCRTRAFDPESGIIRHEECILCMDCVVKCENQPARFRFQFPKNRAEFSFSRRAFIGSAMTGVGLSLAEGVNASPRSPENLVIRPPGAVKEPDFSSLCVRCGECMKVCIKNALNPCFLETGISSMFTPRLDTRNGYCEFNCTLCGQVCPTGAIRKLDIEEKHRTVMGKAFFDKNLCLPYAKKLPCIVCEEHCPTHDKAIKFKTVQILRPDGSSTTLQQPYIVSELCVGCGICENRCPLESEAGVRVMPSERVARDLDVSGYY